MDENWPNQSPTFLTKLYENAECPIVVTFAEIVEKSRNFPIKFPINTVTCQYLNRKGMPINELETNINSVHPIIHEKTLQLYDDFLKYQREFGTKPAKILYKTMTIQQFIDRLLTKRAIVFMGANDRYLLYLNSTIIDGAGNWETIGTDTERPPLILQNCLSYDEIKLSALLSVSSYTYFINDGDRFNCGKFENDRRTLENSGIIIGLIGARFERSNVMEFREIVKTRDQNNHEYGYGATSLPTLQSLFFRFYNDSNLTYQQLEENGDFNNTSRYHHLGYGQYFDKLLYSRRMALTIDLLLLEANARARNVDKMAFIHVVGYGLGVWKLYSQQDQIFADTFIKRTEFFGDKLTNISDICFSYIKVNEIHGTSDSVNAYKDGDFIFNNNIRIHIKNRKPHHNLNDPNQLLIVSYAWDGNSLPGNEFWLNMLDSSGDPATACSTQITELHNSFINRQVSSRNLRIACLNGQIYTLEQYQDLFVKTT